jgi:hypothetical protein
MYKMNESWTDARLDEFAGHVDKRFDAVDKRFDAVDQRFKVVDQRFDAVDQRFDRVEADLRALRTETKSGFDAMHQLMLYSSIAIVVALIGLIATQI